MFATSLTLGSTTLFPKKIGTPAFVVTRSSTSLNQPTKVYCRKYEPESTSTTTKRTLPGPMKLPIIGNLHNLVGSLPYHALRDLAEEHGPIMHLRLGEVSTVVVSSAELADEVLRVQDISFAQRPNLLAPTILTYGGLDIAFAPYGEYWKQMRKFCMTELLSPKRVQSFTSVRHDEVKNLVESVRSSAGSPINFSKMVLLFANKVVCRSAFGSKCSEDKQEAVIEGAKKGTELAAGFNIVDVFPSLAFLQGITGMKAELLALQEQLSEVFDTIIEEHRERLRTTGQGGGESGEDDLLDVLLRLQESGNLRCPITRNSLKAVILDMFTAGTDTSSITSEWAMAEMMKNHRVLKKAQAEVRQNLRGKKAITDADVEELHYLKEVIKETLRLHPPVPLLLPRQSRETCVVNGYEIPGKTTLMINAWALGRDPKYWSDAERFIPERFEDGRLDFKGQNFEFIPFGAGRRICPGMHFGLANVVLPLAQLLYYFDWKLPDGMSPQNLDMTEKFGATVGRKHSLMLIATPTDDISVQHAEATEVLI
ncbi:hypothetical protein K2173_009913 [Erythroxylum novogranatense]|uniref:Cytochrome P450 n=1 Tax=Erythroxylum novogranatense TaxID=1862640 RepID=A0AAV8SZI0_9ROSI|nr:hypothetical protein K2173_009913 [Erythroxylum novogranatense]